MLTKFMVGRDLSAQDFFQYWRHQNFVLNEVTSIVHLAARLRGQLVYVARSIVFGGALRMHHGIDTNPDNFVLVASLADSSARAGLGDSNGHRIASGGLDTFGAGEDHQNG